MRIRVYAHDSNPAVDPPLCHKSKSYVAGLFADGRGHFLDEDGREFQLYEHWQQHYSRTIGPDRPRHWQPIHGTLQFLNGDSPGRKGKFTYPVPYAGYNGRLLIVAMVNGDPHLKRVVPLSILMHKNQGIGPILCVWSG